MKHYYRLLPLAVTAVALLLLPMAATAQEDVRNALERTISESRAVIVTNGVRTVSPDSLEDHFSKMTLKELMSIDSEGGPLGEAVHVASRKMSDELSADICSRLERLLSKEAYRSWRSLVPDQGDDSNRVFLIDLQENNELKHLLTSMSEAIEQRLLSAYLRMIDAPSYRTDMTMLMYLGGSAPIMDALNQTTDIRLVDEGGSTSIYSSVSLQKIGELTGDSKVGFHIEVPFDNRQLLNMYPLSNCHYSTKRAFGLNGWVNLDWETDACGRPVKASAKVSPGGSLIPDMMESERVLEAATMKKNNTVLGIAPKRQTNINDAVGLLLPLSIGGTTDDINVVPLNASLLKKSDWKALESTVSKAVSKGQFVVQELVIKYTDKVDLRPSLLVVSQSINGVETVKGKAFANIVEWR